MKPTLTLFSQTLLWLSIILFSSGCTTALKPQTEATASTPNTAACDCKRAVIPQTNAEIRQWYNDQVVVITKLNQAWRKLGQPAKLRAQKAYEIRHHARIHARLFMQKPAEVKALQQRDLKKYGNPDGPTFAGLVKKYSQEGFKGNEVYEEIVRASGRTSSEYNKRFGIKTP